MLLSDLLLIDWLNVSKSHTQSPVCSPMTNGSSQYSTDYVGLDANGSGASSDECSDISYMTDNTFMILDMEQCGPLKRESDVGKVVPWAKMTSVDHSLKIVLHDENDEAVSVVSKTI